MNSEPLSRSTAFTERVLITLAAIAAYVVLSHIPIWRFTGSFHGSGEALRLLALGLGPIMGGFLLVELFSFILPPLTKWKESGSSGRERLNRLSLAMVFMVSCFQAYSTVRMSESLNVFSESVIFGHSKFAQESFVFVLLLVGVGILYALIVLISKRGLANGFLVVLFFSLFNTPLKGFIDFLKFNHDTSNPRTFDEKMNILYLTAALVFFMIWALKNGRTKTRLKRYFWDRPTVTYTCGTSVLHPESSPLPQTLFSGIYLSAEIIRYCSSFSEEPLWFENIPRVWNFLAPIFDLLPFTLLLWLLFTRPYWTSWHLEDRARFHPPRGRFMNLFLFWTLMALIPRWLPETLTSLGIGFSATHFVLTETLDPLLWLTALILGRELYENIRYHRANEDRECLLEMDNVEMAQLFSAQFKEAGIPFHIEGLRYRQVTQFFAPYVKMKVFVAPPYKPEALRIMDLEHLRQV